MRIDKCRVCGGNISRNFCDLGEQPLANSYLQQADAPEIRLPLRACVCEDCKLVQLDHLASAKDIFSDYAYLSSVSASWVEHARLFCADILRARRPHFVVELASNDGYLLQHFQKAGIACLGVEPALNVAEMARQRGIETKAAFFGRDCALEIRQSRGPADLIIANNVLAHVPDVNDFVAGIKLLLAPSGLVSIEFPHLVELVANVQFDTIYHEHYAYWSLYAAERLLERHGLKVVDVTCLSTHGGSLRLFARHDNEPSNPGEALIHLRRREAELGIGHMAFYEGFDIRVASLIGEVEHFLNQCHLHGETVCAYGAAAKGNTFLNRLGKSARQIACVGDANPLKQGKFLPGSKIPIVSPEDMAAMLPAHILVLPWNLADEIATLLRGMGLSESNMVTAIPNIRSRSLGA